MSVFGSVLCFCACFLCSSFLALFVALITDLVTPVLCINSVTCVLKALVLVRYLLIVKLVVKFSVFFLTVRSVSF